MRLGAISENCAEIGGAAADNAAIGQSPRGGSAVWNQTFLMAANFVVWKKPPWVVTTIGLRCSSLPQASASKKKSIGMDMDEVGIGEMAEDLRGQRIAAAARPGDAHDLDAVDGFARGSCLSRRGKERIERDDANAVAALQRLAGEIGDHIFQAAAVRQKLAHDMNDQRRGIRRGLRVVRRSRSCGHLPPIGRMRRRTRRSQTAGWR